MKNIQSDYIEKLVEIMKNNEITEVTLEDNDASLVIKSNGFLPVIKEKEQLEVVEVKTPNVEEPIVEETTKTNVVPIVSNMIGIFYAKPSPNDEPFVNVGDEIKEGDTICIIETIKLMNKIASTATGKVVEVCIEDGKPVEYGQVIMYVEEN